MPTASASITRRSGRVLLTYGQALWRLIIREVRRHPIAGLSTVAVLIGLAAYAYQIKAIRHADCFTFFERAMQLPFTARAYADPLYPWGYPLLLRIVLALPLVDINRVGQAVSLVGFLAAGLGLGLVVRYIRRVPVPWVVGLPLLALFDNIIRYGTTPGTDMPGLGLCVLACALPLTPRYGRSLGMAVAVGGCFAAAYLFRQTTLVYLAGWLIGMIATRSRVGWGWQHIGAVLAVFAGAWVLVWLPNRIALPGLSATGYLATNIGVGVALRAGRPVDWAAVSQIGTLANAWHLYGWAIVDNAWINLREILLARWAAPHLPGVLLVSLYVAWRWPATTPLVLALLAVCSSTALCFLDDRLILPAVVLYALALYVLVEAVLVGLIHLLTKDGPARRLLLGRAGAALYMVALIPFAIKTTAYSAKGMTPTERAVIAAIHQINAPYAAWATADAFVADVRQRRYPRFLMDEPAINPGRSTDQMHTWCRSHKVRFLIMTEPWNHPLYLKIRPAQRQFKLIYAKDGAYVFEVRS